MKRIITVFMLFSLLAAFFAPPLSADSITLSMIEESFSGDRYDDNIFEIEFPTAEALRSILNESADREAEIELIKSSGLPIIINIKDSIKDIVSCELTVTPRADSKQEFYPSFKTNNGKGIDGIKPWRFIFWKPL